MEAERGASVGQDAEEGAGSTVREGRRAKGWKFWGTRGAAPSRGLRAPPHSALHHRATGPSWRPSLPPTLAAPPDSSLPLRGCCVSWQFWAGKWGATAAPRACGPTTLADCSGALAAAPPLPAAPQGLERVGCPRPRPAPQRPSSLFQPAWGWEAWASLCQRLPSLGGGAVALTAPQAWSPQNSAARGAGTRHPVLSKHPPPGPRLGALCPGPRLSRVGSPPAPPEGPRASGARAPLSLRCQGPWPLLPPPVASRPHPRCCTGPPAGLGE